MRTLIRRLPRLPAILLALTLAAAPVWAHADANAGTATPAQTLQQLGDQLDAVKAALKDAQNGKAGSTPLADLRTSALQVQDQAR